MFPLQGGRPGFVPWWRDSLLHMHTFSQSEPECGGAGAPLGQRQARHPSPGQTQNLLLKTDFTQDVELKW